VDSTEGLGRLHNPPAALHHLGESKPAPAVPVTRIRSNVKMKPGTEGTNSLSQNLLVGPRRREANRARGDTTNTIVEFE
jgi:hypothetical protein